ncbi:MAG: GtrA family protein [Pseudomonadota bacterium]
MIFRYAVAGGAAAAFDLTFFLVFSTWLGYHYLVIGGIGFLLATAINYQISIRIVFQSGIQFGKKQEIAAVYAVSGVGLILHECILYLAVAKFGLMGITGKIIATGAVFFWNYLIRKYYVFRKA